LNIISHSAFSYCSNLSKIIILDDIPIDVHAFLNCTSLKKILIIGNLKITSQSIFNFINQSIVINYHDTKFVDNLQFLGVEKITIYVCSYYPN
jgi:hypothetical protein